MQKSLQETGFYEPPGAFFRFYGFIYIKIRNKPIIAENLEEHIKNNQNYISVFDLFFRYTTPILLANDEYYEIPLKHEGYITDTTTKEGIGWLGNVILNHRPIKEMFVDNGEKNVFFWRGSNSYAPTENLYIRAWSNHYNSMFCKK